MKTILVFSLISILSFSGCSKKETPEQIKKFEEVLGKKNSETLSSLVYSFENDFLKNIYPNLSTEQAYEKLMKDVHSTPEIMPYYMGPTKTQELFQESQLKWELSGYVDSVWVEDDNLNSRIVYKKTGGEIVTIGEGGVYIRDNDNIDSLIQEQKKNQMFNIQGRYLKAIEAIKEDSPFYENYYELKYNFGSIANFTIPAMIKEYNLDIRAYIAKRVIVLELGYM